MNNRSTPHTDRAAALAHIAALLERQRGAFSRYVLILEKQETAISSEDAEALRLYGELAAHEMERICSIEKVIQAFEKPHQAAATLDSLRRELGELRLRAQKQNAKNQTLLRAHMQTLKARISSFYNPYRHTQSVYAAHGGSGNIIHVQA